MKKFSQVAVCRNGFRNLQKDPVLLAGEGRSSILKQFRHDHLLRGKQRCQEPFSWRQSTSGWFRSAPPREIHQAPFSTVSPGTLASSTSIVTTVPLSRVMAIAEIRSSSPLSTSKR